MSLKTIQIITLGFIFFCFCSVDIQAQKRRKNQAPIQVDTIKTKDQTVLIKLNDSSTFIGEILESNDSTLIVKSNAAKIEIKKNNIASITQIDKKKIENGQYYFDNPQSNRYLFSASAFNQKKRESEYKTFYGLGHQYSYGLTDQFSFGIGTEIITLVSGTPLMFINAKLGGIKLADKLYFGASGLIGFIFEDQFESSNQLLVGVASALLTYGDEDSNLTVGLNLSVEGELDIESPLFSISGQQRISRRLALISENWVNPQNFIFSYGVRFMGEKICFDLVFINNKEFFDDIPTGIPSIAFAYKF